MNYKFKKADTVKNIYNDLKITSKISNILLNNRKGFMAKNYIYFYKFSVDGIDCENEYFYSCRILLTEKI